MERAYLCLGCRLLQPATVQCAHCGGTTVAPADLVRDLLAYRDLSLAAERDLGLITALLAGGAIPMPILFPFAVISLGALIVRVPVRRLRAREHAEHRVAPIRVPPPTAAPGSIQVAGVIRRYRGGTIVSRWDGAAVLAEEIAIGTKDGTVLRHAAAAPFFIETAAGERVLVRGAVRILPAARWTQGGRRIRAGDPLPTALGLPADLRVRGTAQRTRLVEALDQVVVTGLGSTEALPEHAALRDAGTTRVLVGEPGAPVLVASPAPSAQT